MPADFSSLQATEGRILSELTSLTEALNRVEWFVEVAPVMGASPKLDVKATRHRVLFDHTGLVWPCQAVPDALPFDTNSVPAVLLRHAWTPEQAQFPMGQWARVIKPGGLLVSVSANPWHPSVWKIMGKRSWRLPSWPHFLSIHAHPDIQLEMHPLTQWRGGLPKLSPVLVLVGQKRCEIAPIHSRRSGRLAVKHAPAVLAQCRAA